MGAVRRKQDRFDEPPEPRLLSSLVSGAGPGTDDATRSCPGGSLLHFADARPAVAGCPTPDWPSGL